ncbi:hypothetical protein P280DRAFT_481398 [Massarina eburnea CBS 473.64]|uniref:Uncharacterized protein n=1 Tax=Massarina eburnea CBS 473.64 TaxID=1395130 RepID=A0A6A6RW51_9PLEO|nr:hypothetical protein P280DRAFT_481398 [Massarina eburnea CBS 473.64]
MRHFTGLTGELPRKEAREMFKAALKKLELKRPPEMFTASIGYDISSFFVWQCVFYAFFREVNIREPWQSEQHEASDSVKNELDEEMISTVDSPEGVGDEVKLEAMDIALDREEANSVLHGENRTYRGAVTTNSRFFVAPNIDEPIAVASNSEFRLNVAQNALTTNRSEVTALVANKLTVVISPFAEVLRSIVSPNQEVTKRQRTQVDEY